MTTTTYRCKKTADYTYDVIADGKVIGSVSQRQGSWWRAFGVDGSSSGSFCYTRKEAIQKMLRSMSA